MYVKRFRPVAELLIIRRSNLTGARKRKIINETSKRVSDLLRRPVRRNDSYASRSGGRRRQRDRLYPDAEEIAALKRLSAVAGPELIGLDEQ
jgi:hypothetical protein